MSMKVRMLKPWLIGFGEREDGHPRWYLYICMHCGWDCREDYYMVHSHIWGEATTRNERRGFLHLRCLEIRLGRALTLGDFTDAPINDMCGARDRHLAGGTPDDDEALRTRVLGAVYHLEGARLPLVMEMVAVGSPDSKRVRTRAKAIALTLIDEGVLTVGDDYKVRMGPPKMKTEESQEAGV